MLSTRRFGRLVAVLLSLIMAIGGLAANPQTASAVTVRVDGSSACQADGTYLLTWAPPPGGTFSPTVPTIVRTKINGATIFTLAPAGTYSPQVTPTQVTMVVPGNVTGTYRVEGGYVDSLGIVNTVVLDVAPVDGTCTASTLVATEAPTTSPTCGPDNDMITLPVVEGVIYTASEWVAGVKTVTATAKPGYVLTGQTTWSFTDANVACDVEAATQAPTSAPVCGPDNDMITLPSTTGVTYTASGWVAGVKTITATAKPGYVLTGQTTWSFTDANVACDVEVATEAPTVAPACGPDNDMITLKTTTGVIYTASEWVDGVKTITATAKPGYVLTGDTTWTFTDKNVACDVEAATQTPTVAPTCGPDNDMITLPTTTGVTYTASEWVDGVKTITATAKPGYVLTGDTTWSFTDKNVACDVDTSNPGDTTDAAVRPLADTGSDAAALLGAALALMVTGGLLLRRRKNSSSVA